MMDIARTLNNEGIFSPMGRLWSTKTGLYA